MKKILAVLAIMFAIPAAVAVSSDVSPVSAASVCSVGWTNPPTVSPGYGSARCLVGGPGEYASTGQPLWNYDSTWCLAAGQPSNCHRPQQVRVEFKCTTAGGVFDPQGWFVGPWVTVTNVFSAYTCNASYPYISTIGWNLTWQ